MWAVQESVSVLLLDGKPLKNPVAHNLHVGCAVALPIFSVYLPSGHVLWAKQELVVVLLLDVEAVKNPFGHISHIVVELAMLTYFPAGHEIFVSGLMAALVMMA